MSLIELTERGARAVVGYRKINRRIKDLSGQGTTAWTQDDAARLEDAERSADVAEQEIERGFPLLHNHALMGLWGALEAMIDDVCVSWLDLHPERVTADGFPRIQVELNQFLALGALEQKRHVVEELKRKQGSAAKIGAGQFEAVLDAIGLGGPIDANVRSVLRIAKSYRNVVAHRGGTADARLLADCPDLQLTLGEPVRVSDAQMQSIIFAMWWYAEEINRRRRQASGLPAGPNDLPPGMTSPSDLSEPFKATETS
ncbi:hypothetical protein GCU56_18780 [Geodermatophilus sabuli]|uniref:Uncharacterized protein n=1 Tax=Geodermatophilus sabuli TaxID=1564158 RepID=A0A7K3W6T3_9ACTN|nr:hypothetical protein [Geodermatophilus sabuli]NEK59904.1 hypothetical protein [Geodermatophilus sabuli]